jgi:hypothetical protein
VSVSLKFYLGTKRNAKRSHFPTTRTKTNRVVLYLAAKAQEGE